MKRSIQLIILITIITIFFILAYLGWHILNSASKTTVSSEIDTKKTYSYNNVNFTYGNEWQEGYYMLGDQKVKAISNKDESISIFAFGKDKLDDGIYDYSNSNGREKFYNDTIDYYENYYSSYGMSIERQSKGFKELKDNAYYCFWETGANYYTRTYMILDLEENTGIIIFVISNNSLTKAEENSVIEILKTVDNLDDNSYANITTPATQSDEETRQKKIFVKTGLDIAVSTAKGENDEITDSDSLKNYIDAAFSAVELKEKYTISGNEVFGWTVVVENVGTWEITPLGLIIEVR